jgi:hypothetical protein
MVSRSRNAKRMLRAGFLAGSMLVLTIASAQDGSKASASPNSLSLPSSPTNSSVQSPASAANWHGMQASYYKRKWGVDIVGVRIVASGAMLRFTYRIMDAEKAKSLNDKRWNPYLIDEASGAKLGVPEMDKVGKLRQTGPAQEGRIYWMVFGNPGQLVKHGNRVDVVIGNFRADGIVVK